MKMNRGRRRGRGVRIPQKKNTAGDAKVKERIKTESRFFIADDNNCIRDSVIPEYY